MVDEPQGQSGLDGETRVAPLPASPATPAGRPGRDRFRGQPHRHIAAANEGLIVGRSVRHAVLRLIRGMNLRLHPCSVAPAEGPEKRGARRHSQWVFSSSPGGSLPRGPHQIRTWRFPPSGSSADVARGSRATTVRSCGDMIRRRRSAGHGSLRTITPTRAAFARPGPGGYPFPGVIARMQPSDSLIPIGLGSGRPLPLAYPGARATRSNEGLPGVRAVLFQRAVVVDPAGCGALLAHGAGPAVAFRLHEALGTQEDVVSRLQGLRPTRSRTYASATALPRSPQGSLPAWVGWPLTGRGSHPLDDTQGFMTYSSIPLDRPAWPHRATTRVPGKPGQGGQDAVM